ncbi:MAG: hypothetical protein R3B49_04925 [Phycisphaerales bacterium]
MQRIFKLIADLATHPAVLLGVVVAVVVIAGIVYYRRATMHKRMLSDAKIMRSRR